MSTSYLTCLVVFKSFYINVDFITSIMENVKVEKIQKEDIWRRMTLLFSTIFPYSCCWKVKCEDKEIQTHGKFISFTNEDELKSFFRNIHNASEWTLSPNKKDQSSEHISRV